MLPFQGMWHRPSRLSPAGRPFAIRHTSRVHHYLPKEFRPAKTIVVIVTDGMENSSMRYSYKGVKRMIRDCEKKHGWEFLFLGANIDAAAEAGRIGIASSPAARGQSSFP